MESRRVPLIPKRLLNERASQCNIGIVFQAFVGSTWSTTSDLVPIIVCPTVNHGSPSPDISTERLIKAAFSAISVVISITYRAEGTRPYDRRVYQNKAQISGPGRTGRRGPVRRRRDHLRRRWCPPARSGAADPDSGSSERMLHRLSRPGSSRTPGGGVDQTAGAGAVPGLRGPQRPRRVVPGPVPGAAVRPGRPDGGVPARGVGSRQNRWQARAP